VVNIEQIVKHIKKGGLVVYPTETSYGLGADATNEVAVRKIFAIKKRSSEKSLPMIVGSLRQAEKFVRFSSVARRLGHRYWPGPLTLVLPIKSGVNLAIGVRFHGTVHGTAAVRVSSHPIARAIVQRLGRPLVSTSANISGKIPCYSIATCKKQFGRRAKDIIFVDGGRLKKQPPSTIVSVIGKKITVIRQGLIVISN